MFSSFLLLALLGASSGPSGQAVVNVSDAAGLRKALSGARPGSTIRIAPGVYPGGLSSGRLRGERDRPIVITGADPRRPPVIQGGEVGLHLSDPSFVELRHLVVAGARGNGINIDDGGSFETPATGIVLSHLAIRDIGPGGNRDGLKMSGVDRFRIEDCTIERWGAGGGSAIDMVGCHDGEIRYCRFRHRDGIPSNGVQIKGGSSGVAIRQCRFEHAGGRSINLGGSTDLELIRPRSARYEARDLVVEDCRFIGSDAPIAFVGVDGATVRHNTFYRPGRFGFRILQETRAPGFVPCRGGVISDNLIVFRSREIREMVNVGDATAPETFTLRHNAWFCQDSPARSRPATAIPEAEGTYGQDPNFADPERGDLSRPADGPLRDFGPRPDAKRSEPAAGPSS